MKKYLMAIPLLLMLGLTMPAAAQNQKKTAQEELVDTTRQDGLEAYSDTTEAATGRDTVYISDPADTYNIDASDASVVKEIIKSVHRNELAGMVLVILILVVIFVLAPLAFLIAILYFIYRNRKQRIQLAQMAMQNGQPIPDQLLNETKADENTYQTGMRQLCLGVGLMVFLGYTAGDVGFGIGVLVFFIGLGKVIIAKTSAKKNDNPSNIEDNE